MIEMPEVGQIGQETCKKAGKYRQFYKLCQFCQKWMLMMTPFSS